MHHIFPVCSSVDGHLGCFHILAIVNGAAMNTGVHVSFQTMFFSRYVPRGGIVGSYDGNKPWKILKEMGIQDHLTCLWRNLYAGQEATVRTGHGTTDWFQTGKGVRLGCILSPYLFNLYAEYIMRNAGLKKHKLESRLPGEISITSDMQMTPPLWQKVKRS